MLKQYLAVAGRRLGSEAMVARVTLEVNWQPQRFRLAPPLASLLGVQSDTRCRVLQARMEPMLPDPPVGRGTRTMP